MSSLPKNAHKIDVEDSTVDFYCYTKNDTEYFYFDTSETTPPNPMINAMLGLQLLKNNTQRLIMINHSIPSALFPRINQNFEFDLCEIENEKIKIEFKYKEDSQGVTDFTNNKCSG